MLASFPMRLNSRGKPEVLTRASCHMMRVEERREWIYDCDRSQRRNISYGPAFVLLGVRRMTVLEDLWLEQS